MNRKGFAALMAIFACVLGSAAASAAPTTSCKAEHSMQIRGDVPGAISFDVYSQLQPLSAQRLALFESTGQVRRLADGRQYAKSLTTAWPTRPRCW